MTSINATSGTTGVAATQNGGSSVAAQIAQLRKQETALMQDLKDLKDSDGDAEDIAKQSAMIQQQIAAIELQIARLENERAESQKSSNNNPPAVAAKTVASLTEAADVSRTGDVVDLEA